MRAKTVQPLKSTSPLLGKKKSPLDIARGLIWRAINARHWDEGSNKIARTTVGLNLEQIATRLEHGFRREVIQFINIVDKLDNKELRKRVGDELHIVREAVGVLKEAREYKSKIK